MVDDASEMAKLGADASLGLVGYTDLIAGGADSTVGDPADHVKRPSALAVSYITGVGNLPGTMGQVYPVGSFKGLTVLPIDHLYWEKETGDRPEQDVPSWWPGSNAASGRSIPFSALTERK